MFNPLEAFMPLSIIVGGTVQVLGQTIKAGLPTEVSAMLF